MRRTTFMWMVLAIVVGVGLYAIKQQVQEAEDRLISLNGQILKNQQAIHVLRAEWSYLTQPARLESLSRKLLKMQPTDAGQFIVVEQLPNRAQEHIAEQRAQIPGAPSLQELAARSKGAAQ